MVVPRVLLGPVVQQHQLLALAHVIGELLLGRPRRLVTHIERRQHHLRDPRRIRQARQIHHPHPITKRPPRASSHLHRQPRLTDPTRTNERDEPRLGHPPPGRRHLSATTNKTRHAFRQPARCGRQILRSHHSIVPRGDLRLQTRRPSGAPRPSATPDLHRDAAANTCFRHGALPRRDVGADALCAEGAHLAHDPLRHLAGYRPGDRPGAAGMTRAGDGEQVLRHDCDRPRAVVRGPAERRKQVPHAQAVSAPLIASRGYAVGPVDIGVAHPTAFDLSRHPEPGGG